MERIAVLDFGGQYNQLIVRRIRDLGVYAELYPSDVDISRIKDGLIGIVLTGGPDSVYAADSKHCDPAILELGVPVLGICYGIQWLAYTLGGKVGKAGLPEFGDTPVALKAHALFAGIKGEINAWMSHNDSVTELPAGFMGIAKSENCPIAAMANEERKLYGVQFHPEVEHTADGDRVLQNFLYTICGATGGWTMGDMVEAFIGDIKAQVGNSKLLCALSGGVDSSVAAALVHRAVGDRLTCVFVDHGLMRKNEPQEVLAAYEKVGLTVIHVDAADRFLGKLAGVDDPEQKRKIIGEEFIRVFEEEAKKLGQVDYLVQGTIYPDIIESGTNGSALIKSHHNVGGLPEDMDFKGLVEPLRLLFKDEVRALGEALGLPESQVWRQPFPGPGLGVRVLGDITKEKLFIVRESDAILREEVKNAGWERKIWQYFTVFLPVKAVGVKGDSRVYENVVAVRAITSTDAMTARVSHLPFEVLERIGTRIANEVPGVARVVYDITSKPPGTIEWE
ncbi:glutamine-hydrolyzing GMP synthase [Eubacteriales bacterium OttesenSCG-928-M02]|nr:glutamine-hydrolyzing GMP synthase [Eubacteriales bacterium OttesenSCG-928-M02]